MDPFAVGVTRSRPWPRRLVLERDVADLVDDEQRVAGQAAQLVLQPAGAVVLGEPVDPLGCCREQDPVAGPSESLGP